MRENLNLHKHSVYRNATIAVSFSWTMTTQVHLIRENLINVGLSRRVKKKEEKRKRERGDMVSNFPGVQATAIMSPWTNWARNWTGWKKMLRRVSGTIKLRSFTTASATWKSYGEKAPVCIRARELFASWFV